MKKITKGDAYNSGKDIMIINLDTNEKLLFKSKYQCAIYLKVSPALIHYFVNKKNNNILVSNGISYEVTYNIDKDAKKVLMKKEKKDNNEIKDNNYEANKEKCRDSQRKYIEKFGKVKCDICNVDIRYYYKKRHDDTKTHIYNKYILNKN
jgi:hypothetical protein